MPSQNPDHSNNPDHSYEITSDLEKVIYLGGRRAIDELTDDLNFDPAISLSDEGVRQEIFRKISIKLRKAVASISGSASPARDVLLDLRLYNSDLGNLVELFRPEIMRTIEQCFREEPITADINVTMLGKSLGKGGVGEVFLGHVGERGLGKVDPHFTVDELIAVKLSEENEEGNRLEKLDYHRIPELREISLKSRYLNTYHGTFELEEPRSAEKVKYIDVYEAMPDALNEVDFLDGQSLTLKQYLRTIFIPVLKGVRDLHSANLIHLDLKPTNILITSNKSGFDVKLTDYDILRRSGFQPQRGCLSGTPMYMSPEQWNSNRLTCRSDIYSLGMYLHDNHFEGKFPHDWKIIMAKTLFGKVDLSSLNAPP